MNIVQAFEDSKIFGSLFKNQETWINWKVCLKAIFAIPMDRNELRIYKKFTGREKLPRSPFKEIFLVIGRRGGKSFISALIAVYLAVFKNWTACLGPGEIGYIMCLASDKAQAGVVLNYIKEILRLPIFKGYVVNETKEEIQLKNNIIISVHTCSYRSLRGYTVLAAICDEIAFWRVEGANPAKEILTALRPSLGNIPDSLLLGISTGYSKTGPLWEAFRDKYGQDDKEVLVWRAGTLDMNPTYKKKVIDRALKDDFSAARAEYFGEFREDLETFLSTEVLEACVVPGRYELPKQKQRFDYVAFVDPSGGRGDAMTLSICHKEDSGKIIQDCIRIKKPPFNPHECVKEFAEVLKSYGISSTTGDRYSGEWCSSSFEKEGITYKNAELSKSDIYLEFLPLVMQRKVELLDNKQQIIELKQLERRTGKGKDTVDHPKGLHDDLANAAAGACVLANSESEGVFFVFSKHDFYGDYAGQINPHEFMREAMKQGIEYVEPNKGNEVISSSDLDDDLKLKNKNGGLKNGEEK